MNEWKKGFVINMDAIIALSFVFFALVIIASQSYYPKTPGSIYLKQLTLDTVMILEKTGRINTALDGNITSVQEIVEATPPLACMRFTIINSAGNAITLTEKSNCNETAGLDIQTSASPVFYNGSKYMLKSESWFRKEPEG